MDKIYYVGEWRISKNSWGVWAAKHTPGGFYGCDLVVKNISDVLELHEIGDDVSQWTEGEAIMVLLAL